MLSRPNYPRKNHIKRIVPLLPSFGGQDDEVDNAAVAQGLFMLIITSALSQLNACAHVDGLIALVDLRMVTPGIGEYIHIVAITPHQPTPRHILVVPKGWIEEVFISIHVQQSLVQIPI